MKKAHEARLKQAVLHALVVSLLVLPHFMEMATVKRSIAAREMANNISVTTNS
jgi:hypothetical protein